MNTYEVAAIGELFKKNIGGRRKWNLRNFGLSGNRFIYCKNSEKRGEYDISGCTVRKITAEEAKLPSAKFAFTIEGKNKNYIFNARNEKTRDIWIYVLENHLREYRNPVREFLRTGEVVHANGLFFRRKNILEKQCVRVVVTNFPRIILMNSIDSTLINQYEYSIETPPTITTISNSSCCIEIKGVEIKLFLDEPDMGIKYWEEAFRSINQIEVFKPKTNITVVINVTEYNEGQKLFDKSLLQSTKHGLVLRQGVLVEAETVETESIYITQNQVTTNDERFIIQFIQNNEMVYGNGLFYKRNNFFEKQCVRVVVTDFPRILLLDSVDHKVLKQYGYKYDSPPKFTQTAKTSCIIEIKGVVKLFLDVADMDMIYWEEVFQNLNKKVASKSFKDTKTNVPVSGLDESELWEGSAVVEEMNAVLINNSNEANDGLLVSCKDPSVLRLANLLSQSDSAIVKSPRTILSHKTKANVPKMILSAHATSFTVEDNTLVDTLEELVTGTDVVKNIKTAATVVDAVQGTINDDDDDDDDDVDTITAIAKGYDVEDEYNQINVSELLASPAAGEGETIEGIYTNENHDEWSSAFTLISNQPRESFVMLSTRLACTSKKQLSDDSDLEDASVEASSRTNGEKPVKENDDDCTCNPQSNSSDTESENSSPSKTSALSVLATYSPSKLSIIPLASKTEAKASRSMRQMTAARAIEANRMSEQSRRSSRSSKHQMSINKRKQEKGRKIDISYVSGQRIVRGYTIQQDQIQSFAANLNFSV